MAPLPTRSGDDEDEGAMRVPYEVAKRPFRRLLDMARECRSRTREKEMAAALTNFRIGRPRTVAQQIAEYTKATATDVNVLLVNDVVATDEAASDARRFVRIYALGMADGSDEQTILYTDVEMASEGERSQFDGSVSSSVWKRLLPEQCLLSECQQPLTREEELLRERKRARFSSRGIAFFHLDSAGNGNRLFFRIGAKLCQCIDNYVGDVVSVSPVDLTDCPSGPILNVDFCPPDNDLFSFVLNGDVYVHSLRQRRTLRCTFSSDDPNGELSCGMPEFIIQEEFNRYTGTWWSPVAPASEPTVTYLLCEENDRSPVEQVVLARPGERLTDQLVMRYPFAGTANHTSQLKLFRVDRSADLFTTTSLILPFDLKSVLPYEYIVRAGWVPDGMNIWAELWDREQSQLWIVRIPISAFQSADRKSNGLENADRVVPIVSVLYEESTETYFTPGELFKILSVTKMDKQRSLVRFIRGSDTSGYSHLYLIEAVFSDRPPIGEASQTSAVHVERSTFQSRTALTSGGKLMVNRNRPIFVDEAKKNVYFVASGDPNPLESHVYVVPLVTNATGAAASLRRLTPTNRCFSSLAAPEFLLNSRSAALFLVDSSSLSTPSQYEFYQLNSTGECVAVTRLGHTSKSPADPQPSVSSGTADDNCNRTNVRFGLPSFAQPSAKIIISYVSKRSGQMQYAMLIKPSLSSSAEGNMLKFPVLHYVYGGPEVQLVRNALLRGTTGSMLEQFANSGFAVVMVDGRGSSNRGVDFESAIQGNMGSIEVEDQVEGLRAVAESGEAAGLLDLDRVAVFGWSYGGYVALQALARRPDVYKSAVAGGPVTSWYLYDTAYTERYMGLPTKNKEAYDSSSVLGLANKFPDEDGRLLLVHGLIDENVHFNHTIELVDALHRHGKPFDVKFYPNERHGVRSADCAEHMYATILQHLQKSIGSAEVCHIDTDM